MKPILIANFKNYLTPAKTLRVVCALRTVGRSGPVERVVCPSPAALAETAIMLRKTSLHVGAQNFDITLSAAVTGSLSLDDLQATGCRYVIIGHSEQRAAGETDAQVAKKIKALSATGIIPILCVGEPFAIRRRGHAVQFVLTQVRHALADWRGKHLLLAYEPIWAITGHGKNIPCPPKDAFAMADAIRRALPVSRKKNVRLLYGGSISAPTIAQYVDGAHFQGALVGKASTTASGYATMVRALQ